MRLIHGPVSQDHAGANEPEAVEIHRVSVRRHLNQVRRGGLHGRFARIRIEHRQAAPGGEPQAPVFGAYAAARDRIGRRALCAAQAVFHAVILRLQTRPLPRAELK